jgi:regulator of protease activity HflC (stomatin/prohibitin superfamily)
MVAVFALIMGLSAFATSCTPVEKGHVGVSSYYGAVQAQPRTEGLHFVRPFGLESVEIVDVRMRKAEAKQAASSGDLQGVTTTIAVQYSLVGSMVPKVVQKFGNADAVDANVIGPAVSESVKAVTARYSAEGLITKRSEAKAEIEQELREFVKKTLKSKDCAGAINFQNIAITDFKFSEEFDASIEAKVKAEQDALKALNEKKKKITQAEAQAQERKLKADAVAYQTEVESQARADAIKREAAALKNNPALIQLRKAEKWDGKLPHYTGGGAVPFMNIK